jgi:hypothetical protein
MFVAAQKKTFPSTVIAHMPEGGGRTKKISFTVEFKALSKTEVDELLAKARKSAKANQEALETGSARTHSSDRELIDEVLVGFGKDLVEEDNTPMLFTPENVDRLCDIWPIEAAIAKSFIDNYIQAPVKN